MEFLLEPQKGNQLLKRHGFLRMYVTVSKAFIRSVFRPILHQATLRKGNKFHSARTKPIRARGVCVCVCVHAHMCVWRKEVGTTDCYMPCLSATLC